MDKTYTNMSGLSRERLITARKVKKETNKKPKIDIFFLRRKYKKITKGIIKINNFNIFKLSNWFFIL